MFRRFEEEATPGEVEVDDNLSDHEINRKAGATTTRRFTRSKDFHPRLLFPNEEQRLAREAAAAEEADEEAVTDIEVPQPKTATTPTKQHFHPRTPPSTVRPKRTKGPVIFEDAIVADAEVVQLQQELAAADVSAVPIMKPKKRAGSAFSGWSSGKSSRAGGGSKKREGGPIVREDEEPKRTRSGAYAAPSTSI
jgi:hypothetical protein